MHCKSMAGRPGVEPGSTGSEPGILPLNYHPVFPRLPSRDESGGGWGGIRTHGTVSRVHLLSRQAPSTTRPPIQFRFHLGSIIEQFLPSQSFATSSRTFTFGCFDRGASPVRPFAFISATWASNSSFVTFTMSLPSSLFVVLIQQVMADGAGFEPAGPFRVRSLSKGVP